MGVLPQIKIKPVKRSNRNLSFKNRFTMMPGAVYPVAFYRVFPGEHFEFSISNLIKSLATKAPIMGSMQLRFDVFFCADRLYNPRLRSNELTTFDDLYDFSYPLMSFPDNSIHPQGADIDIIKPEDVTRVMNENSLWNFLGFPKDWFCGFGTPAGTDLGSITLNGTKLLNYLDIYRNYFVNPQESSFHWMSEGKVASTSVESLNTFFVKDLPDLVESGEAFNAPGVSRLSAYFNSPWNNPGDLLLLSCYRPDYLSNWISSTNYNKLATVARVNTDSGSFTIDQLRLGNKLQKMAERIIISGNRYGEAIRALFGVNTDLHLDIPEYLGSSTTQVTFDDVVSQSNGTGDFNQNLGDVGGRAAEFGRSRKFYVNPSEFGNIVITCRLIPIPDYHQGLSKDMTRLAFSDEYNPSLARLGWQALYDYELAFGPIKRETVSDGTYMRQPWPGSAVAYQPAWLDYLTRVNELHGDFAGDLSYWTLGRSFIRLDSQGRFNVTGSAYIHPNDFQYPFVDTTQGARNFMVQVGVDCFAKRVIPKSLMPNLG